MNISNGLDKIVGKPKNTANSGRFAPAEHTPTQTYRVYDFNPAVAPEQRSSMSQCKHPRVRVVSRDEESEFVECLECAEVFESSEFKDMSVEETKLSDEL
jgi:hypothetical protein